MLKELVSKNPADKIISICFGLTVVSAVLFIAYFIDIDKFTPIVFDDYLFGYKINFFHLFYIIDIIIWLTIIDLVLKKIIFGIALGAIWTIFNLIETLFDVPIFGFDPHFVLEEMAFILIYSYLLILFFKCYVKTEKAPLQGFFL